MTEVGVRSGDIVDRRSVTFRGEASDVVAPEMYEDETYPLLSGIDPYNDAVSTHSRCRGSSRNSSVDPKPWILAPAVSARTSVGRGARVSRCTSPEAFGVPRRLKGGRPTATLSIRGQSSA
jgi:hypothetical protein